MAMIWRGFYFYRRRMDRRPGAAGPGVSADGSGADGALHRRHPDAASAGEHATTRVSNTVTRIVSEAVYEAIEKGELQYDGLVSFEKDTEGHITAVQSNMAAFNHLQRRFWTRS